MLEIALEQAAAVENVALPPGVTMERLPAWPAVENAWLEWFPSMLAAHAGAASIGLLRARRADPAVFETVEWHTEPELFLMVSGEGTMLLADGQAWKLATLTQGTVLRVGSGVAHYFGPALTQEALCAVVTLTGAQTMTRAV